MLRLAGATLAVGLADSLNPSTVGPALYLATGRRAAARVTLFALGVFGVNLAAGALLTLGPGRLIVGLLPHPQRVERSAIELAAGAVLVAVAAGLWAGRRSLARRELPMRGGGGGSALVAGASIAAVELPTAAPYFAVIAAIVASRPSVAQAVGLVALYCVAFVAPLLAIAVILLVAGDRATGHLERGAAWLQRRWPVVLAALLLLVGGGLIVAGAIGLLRA
jgi:cytochrome c biogenesis protein CcdA